VKTSGRDEPMKAVIHKCMEAMLGISLHLKLAKPLCHSYYLFCFLFNKIREQEGGTGSAWKEEGREVAQTMYAYVSKCTNNKKERYSPKENSWSKCPAPVIPGIVGSLK
jgi:hypothetical protein